MKKSTCKPKTSPETLRCPSTRSLGQQCSLPVGHGGPHCEGNEAWDNSDSIPGVYRIPQSSQAAAVVRSPATLYDIETDLLALSDPESYPDLTPELRLQYERDLQSSLHSAIAKRDSVARALTWLLAQADLAADEIDRLKARERRFRSQAERLSNYVLLVAKEISEHDADGKILKLKKLEGSTFTLAPRKCPPSVEIEPQQASVAPHRIPFNMVPLNYTNVTIKLSGQDFLSLFFDQCHGCSGTGHLASIIENVNTEEGRKGVTCMLCSGLGQVPNFFHSFIQSLSFDEKKTAIKEAIEAGISVPHARLIADKLRLEVL